MVRRYVNGESCHDIAKTIGFNHQVVRQVLLDSGLMRSRSEAAALRAQNRAPSHSQSGKFGAYHSEKNRAWLPVASRFEFIRMDQLEQDSRVVSFARCRQVVAYRYKGKTHRYAPDIEVTYVDESIVIEEIKPHALMNSGRNLAKAVAAFNFYAEQGKRFVFVNEFDIGLDLIKSFEWPGLMEQAQEEIERMRRDRIRKTAREYARRHRELNPKTPEQRAAHAARTREYSKKWKATASPEQIESRKARATENARRMKRK